MSTARRDNDMSTTEQGPLTLEEQEVLAATAERVRQLRRHAGIPDGMSVEKAIAWHIISPDELERARWGPDADASIARSQPSHAAIHSRGA